MMPPVPTPTPMVLVLSVVLLAAAAPAQEPPPPEPVQGDAGGPHIELGGELSWRTELRDPADLATGVDESDDPMRFRARADLRIAFDDYFQTFLDLMATTSDTGGPSRESLHQAYVHLHRFWGGYDLRAGRFELDFGDGRLVSSNPWEFVPNSFDGLQVSDGGDRHDWAVWWTEGADGLASDLGDTFAGAWGAIPAGHRGILEGYLLWRRRSPVEREEVTYALRWSGSTVHGFDWNAFGAFQDGSHGDLDIRSQAAALTLEKELDHGHHVGAEVAVARGDKRDDDEDLERFDPVFIEHHAFNGKADVVAFSNLVDLGLFYWLQWNERWSFHVDFHDFQRQNTDDDVILGYERTAVPVADEARAIGREFDVYLEGTLTARCAVDVGAAWFDAGPAMPTGENQIWLFLHLVLDF